MRNYRIAKTVTHSLRWEDVLCSTVVRVVYQDRLIPRRLGMDCEVWGGYPVTCEIYILDTRSFSYINQILYRRVRTRQGVCVGHSSTLRQRWYQVQGMART